MQHFQPCLDPNAYTAQCKREGYTSQRRGGSKTWRGKVRVSHVTVIEGPNMPPRLIVRWEQRNDPEAINHCHTMQCVNPDELRKWVADWFVTLSQKKRHL